MAYTTGTASNYKDLLAAMVTFASANNWTVLEQSESRIFLKGTGLAGLDEIYAGVDTYEYPTSGIYNWNMVGSWGYRAGRAPKLQPHNSNRSDADLVVGYFWNTSMQYWMVANGRRIIVVAKVGTTYQTIHLGLLTPPATDNQYPYPLLIGGAGSSNGINYSSASISSFWSLVAGNYNASRLHFPGGLWGTQYQSGTGIYSEPMFVADNICSAESGNILAGLDGTYLLEPVYMVGSGTLDIFGHVEGLFRITGHNNTSENVIAVSGVNYIVFQDCSRSGYGDFCAMRMN